MATVAYSYGGVCAGGGHVTIGVSFNGGPTQNIVYPTDEIRAPLSELTEDERAATALIILKAHCAGMTRAQEKTALQAGITVTL